MEQINDFIVDFFLDRHYPLTIVHDRYGGTYSKGKYLAFPYEFDQLSSEISGDDISCAMFWREYDKNHGFVGKGKNPNAAIKDLENKLAEEKFNGYPHCV